MLGPRLLPNSTSAGLAWPGTSSFLRGVGQRKEVNKTTVGASLVAQW